MAENTIQQQQSECNTINAHTEIDDRTSLNTHTMIYRKDSYNVEHAAN